MSDDDRPERSERPARSGTPPPPPGGQQGARGGAPRGERGTPRQGQRRATGRPRREEAARRDGDQHDLARRDRGARPVSGPSRGRAGKEGAGEGGTPGSGRDGSLSRRRPAPYPERSGRPGPQADRGGPPARAAVPRASGSGRPAGSGLDRETQQPARLLGPRREGPDEPQVSDDVTGTELERPVRAQLRSLSKANAEMVARHLVMAGRLLSQDPHAAYAHAMAAQRRAGRVAVVREAVGVTAYHAGLWAEALAELRAARRMSGSSHQLPLMADAERGLGRPERALQLAASPEAASLSTAERVELATVVSGARLDLGQVAAAVVCLQIPELTSAQTHAFTPRLRYAYAQALLAAGREEEALHWFAQAADSDLEGVTDADDRLAELQGLEFTDLDSDSDIDSDSDMSLDPDSEEDPGDVARDPAHGPVGADDGRLLPDRGDPQATDAVTPSTAALPAGTARGRLREGRGVGEPAGRARRRTDGSKGGEGPAGPGGGWAG